MGVKIHHVFPNDYRAAVSAINKGQPLAESTQGRLAESYSAFAEELTGVKSESGSPESGGGGFFGLFGSKRS